MTMALDWVHEARLIGARGVSETRTAAEDERAELARVLDILSCDRLKMSYRIEPLNRNRFRLTGALEAEVTQACVVTLEPVPEIISERFDIELRPEKDTIAPSEEEQEILSTPDIEIVQNGRIEVGTIAYELLSAALNLYPRKEGAEFDWVDPKAVDTSEEESPFAVLSKLRSKE